jgi:capsular polysaccharide transport system ATP-binding protein
MIALRGVTTYRGLGVMRHLVLNAIDLRIADKAKLVVLGQRASGKSSLLQVMSGTLLPDSGRVERTAHLSSPGGLLRYAGATLSTRHHVSRLSKIYGVNPDAVLDFIMRLADVKEAVDRPVMSLPASLRQRIDSALTFAIPFGYYLFDERIAPPVPTAFRDACHHALAERLKSSGLIFATSSISLARQFEGGGAILHAAKLKMFATVEEAIYVFQQLPPTVDYPDSKAADRTESEEEDEFG